MKYEISLSNDFGESNVIVVNTADGFTKAIGMALDSHYDDEDKVVEIRCRKVEESEVFYERSNT